MVYVGAPHLQLEFGIKGLPDWEKMSHLEYTVNTYVNMHRDHHQDGTNLGKRNPANIDFFCLKSVKWPRRIEDAPPSISTLCRPACPCN